MREKSRTEYAVVNIFVGLGGYVLSTLLGFVSRMVFTRTLTAEYLGISGLFSNILTMLSLAELGIGSAIVYALYKPLATHDRDKVASLVKFYGQCYRVIGCVVAIIGLAVMPFLDEIIQQQPNIKENLNVIYLIFLFNTASSYFFSYRSSLLIAAQQNYLVTGINYCVLIVQTILQVGWLVCTGEYLGYLIIQAIGTLVYNVIISSVAKKRYPYIVSKNIQPISREERNGLVKNVRALVIYKMSGLLVNSTDNLIITFFNGLTMVGLASNYTLLTNTVNSLLNQIFNGITASVGNLNATETKEKKIEVFETLNLMNFWLFSWAAIGIFVVSTDLVRVLFGENYVLPLEIPLVLAVNFYMVGMQNAVWTFKNAMGLFRPGRYLLILTAIINLVASILLGQIYGLFGILAATALSRLLTNTWYDPYAVYRYGFKEKPIIYYKKYIKYAFVTIVGGAICWCVCQCIDIIPLLNVFLQIVTCSVLTNAVFWLAFRKDRAFIILKKRVSAVLTRVLRTFINRLHR